MEENAHHRPQALEPQLADSHADVGTPEDATLQELAALETEVDNWLNPPAKVEQPSMTVEQPQVDPPEQPFTPAINQRTSSRWPRLALLSALGAGAVAAAVGAVMFVSEETKTDNALEAVATSTRNLADKPAVPALVSPAKEQKPVDMVFLNETPAADTTPAEPAGEPEAPGLPEETVEEPPPVANVAADEKKTTVSKKTPKKKPTALAKRTENEKRRRRLSDTERVNAAVAQCRATSSDPGACNIRVCDVLGSAHPACRE